MKEFTLTVKGTVQDHDEDVIPKIPAVILERFHGTAIGISEVTLVKDNGVEVTIGGPVIYRKD